MRRVRWLAAAAVCLVALAGAPALAAAPTTTRVSVSTAGTQADDDSRFPAVDATGTVIAFDSHATNLVPGDGNGRLDVFVRDRGQATTVRVSVATGGGDANDISARPTIDASGTVVAFESPATNLIVGDTNNAQDVFVRDLAAGTTRRVSRGLNGAQPNGASANAAVSADGRYVAFGSFASNLVAGDTNNAQDVFVRDLQTTVIRRVSVDAGGRQGNGASGQPSISARGTLVAFNSHATNLVPGDTNARQDVFVHDTTSGTTTRVSVTSTGREGNGHSFTPSIAGDGSHVAFASEATNLVPGDTNGSQDVFVHPLPAGATERVSVSSNGVEGNGPSGSPSMSSASPSPPSGQRTYVAFVSTASNLVPSDTNLVGDIFRRERLVGGFGVTTGTTRWSLAQDGSQSFGLGSGQPAITPSGQHIAFVSEALNLVPGDTNSDQDVFVRGP